MKKNEFSKNLPAKHLNPKPSMTYWRFGSLLQKRQTLTYVTPKLSYFIFDTKTSPRISFPKERESWNLKCEILFNWKGNFNGKSQNLFVKSKRLFLKEYQCRYGIWNTKFSENLILIIGKFLTKCYFYEMWSSIYMFIMK